MLKKFIFGCVTTLAVSCQSWGAIVFTESFTYPDGPLVTRPGTPWITSSGTANEQNVVSNELFLNDNETEDTRANFVDSSSALATFQLRMDPLDLPGTGGYFAHLIGDTDFIGAPSDFIARLYVRQPTIPAAGEYQIGVGNTTGTVGSAVYLTTNLVAGTVYDVTLGFTTGSNASLSVAGIGSVNATDAAAAIVRLGGFGWRQTTNTGDQFVDNLSIDATAVPEPSSMALVALVGIVGVASRYRRKNASTSVAA
ncbi:MAG: PEP-CTERM sorting domain-containing protein [Planctomycetota bacterium]|nr:PEP-CTERM sorting domain-containing protein [Planctomycetota bacterium]